MFAFTILEKMYPDIHQRLLTITYFGIMRVYFRNNKLSLYFFCFSFAFCYAGQLLCCHKNNTGQGFCSDTQTWLGRRHSCHRAKQRCSDLLFRRVTYQIVVHIIPDCISQRNEMLSGIVTTSPQFSSRENVTFCLSKQTVMGCRKRGFRKTVYDGEVISLATNKIAKKLFVKPFKIFLKKER